MAHGAVRRPPYPAVLALTGGAIDNWHYIDGWCAARGIDPMRLSGRRFINLMYFIFRQGVEHDKKKLREFERSLTRGQRSDGRPTWYQDDKEAAESSLAAARALGLQV